MNRMKTMALTLLMGVCALWMTIGTANAQIDPMRSGGAWQGFSWNPDNTAMNNTSLAIWSENGNTFTAGLSYMGRGHAMGGRFSADGSVFMADLYNSPPLTLQGTIVPTTSGGQRATFRVTQGGVDCGLIALLNLYRKADALGMSPPDPTAAPGPGYNGFYQTGGSRVAGRAQFLFNPSQYSGDQRNPPSAFSGRLSFGDAAYQFVATLNPERRADGSYAFDVIGHRTGLVIPCIRISGGFLPENPFSNPQSFAGMYELVNPDMSIQSQGTIDVSAP